MWETEIVAVRRRRSTPLGRGYPAVMASEANQSSGGGVFTTGLLAGIGAGVLLAIIAFVTAGSGLGIPVLVLTAVCAAAAIVYRIVGGAGPRANTDPSASTVPQLPTEEHRPLGDTPQAHDEINPHDLPKDNPGREVAVEMAEGHEGSTEGTDGER